MIILGVIGTSVSLSNLLLGIGSSRTSFNAQQAAEAKALASACAEQALDSLRQNTSYSGDETINLGNGSCDIQSIGGSGNSDRTIQVIGKINTIQRKIKIEITEVQPNMTISTWQEVTNL